MSGIDLSLINHPIIILENNGLIWTFESNAHDDFICRYSVDGGKKWSDNEILMPSFSGEFSLTFDMKDNLHLACVDTKGQLFYLLWNGELWTKKHIPVEGTAISVSLAVNKDKVDLVYLTFSKDDEHKWFLHHSRIEGNRRLWEHLIVSGSGHFLNKAVICYDNKDNLYAVYRTFEGTNYQLFYTFMKSLGHSWEKANPIGQHADNSNPCLLADDKGDLHLTYTVSDGKNLRVAYTKKSQVTGWLMPEWTPMIYLSGEGQNAYTPTMILKDSQVLVLWQQVDGIFRRISFDNGIKWEDIYRDPQLEDIVNLTPFKFSESKEKNYKLSSFGATTSDLLLIVASYLSKEEFLSPTPAEYGNHIIFPLKDNLMYIPKGMQLFSKILNNHLQTLIATLYKGNDEGNPDHTIGIQEAEQINIIITELNKRIDILRNHSATLSSKLTDAYQELEEKKLRIEELQGQIQGNIENNLTKEVKTDQDFKILLNFK